MPRTNARATKMTNTISIRATADDVAQIRLKAQRRGMDLSAYLRDLLIRNQIINPLGTGDEI